MNTPDKKIISKHGLVCKGPCYFSNIDIIHPLYLEKVTMDKPFCPVNEWTFIDPITKKPTRQIVDECSKPTEKTQEKTITNILLPNIDFDPKFFLTYVYDLTTFEDTINWLVSQSPLPLGTRMRVLIAALKGYTEDIKILDYRVSNLIIELFLYNIELFYDSFFNNITVIGDGVKIVSKNYDQQNDNYLVKKNYIINSFITQDRIYKFLIKFMNSNKNNLNNINQNSLIDEFINYIKNKIINTVKNKSTKK
jgi:hypothetical protein